MHTPRIDLQALNWLAHVLDPKAPLVRLEDPNDEINILHSFLEASKELSRFQPLISVKGIPPTCEYTAGPGCTGYVGDRRAPSADVMMAVRHRLAYRPWTVLIVPSYEDEVLDSFLCSESFKTCLVRQMKGKKNGLILQPHYASERAFDLIDVFPTFLAALGEATQWPGLLVWTQSSKSVFLALPRSNPEMIQSCAAWVIGRLVATSPINLETVRTEYLRQFLTIHSRYAGVLHLLHISDVHIGSRIARQRLPRLESLIEKEVEQLKQSGTVRPVITGDLLNSPNRRNLDDAQSFLRFLHGLRMDAPTVVLGNHDVRKSGILSEDFKAVLNLPINPIVWLPEHMVGLVCFHSITKGRLARGYIGERQFMNLGTHIEEQEKSKDYALIGLLHHHPIPVGNPGWPKTPFYAKWLGRSFEHTVELEDAAQFREFVIKRSLRAVLHGHKHIPRAEPLSKESDIPVFGCGSSVGKIETKDGGPYISVNVISIDRAANKLVGRLLIEKSAGAGFEEERHERILRADLMQ